MRVAHHLKAKRTQTFILRKKKKELIHFFLRKKGLIHEYTNYLIKNIKF